MFEVKRISSGSFEFPSENILKNAIKFERMTENNQLKKTYAKILVKTNQHLGNFLSKENKVYYKPNISQQLLTAHFQIITDQTLIKYQSLKKKYLKDKIFDNR